MSKQYELVFYGDLIPGFTEAMAKQNIAKLFKASEQQISIFFSGKRVVIKNQLDQLTAQKYLQAMKKAGLDCQLAEMGEVEPKTAQQATQPTAVTSSQPASSEDTISTSQNTTSQASATSDWSIAPTGTLMKDPSNKPPPPAPDTSKLSIAPMKGYIVEPNKKPPPPPPDTSHLNIEPPETDKE